MIVRCAKCGIYLDDEFRRTTCPHTTFPANDGRNHFDYHEDAYLSKIKPNEIYIIDDINVVPDDD